MLGEDALLDLTADARIAADRPLGHSHLALSRLLEQLAAKVRPVKEEPMQSVWGSRKS